MMLLSILLIMVDNFSFQDVREHIDDVRDRENEIGGFQAFAPPQSIIITKIIIL